jgi:hypothetical protein
VCPLEPHALTIVASASITIAAAAIAMLRMLPWLLLPVVISALHSVVSLCVGEIRPRWTPLLQAKGSLGLPNKI